MKRNLALIPLSREHHDGLVLARLIQKNAPAYKHLPTNNKEKAEYALKLFNTVLKKHFDNEDILLKNLKHKNVEIEKLSIEIAEEHIVLSNTFNTLINSNNVVDDLHNLGYNLEQHIRKEERVLFPLLQQVCTNDELKEALFVF